MAHQVYTKEELHEQYKRLPSALKDAMFSAEVADKIFSVGKKHGLTIEQVGFLAEETGYVTLGFTKPMDFVSVLKDRLGIDIDATKKIAADINQEVFFPIREAFKQAHNELVDFESMQNTAPLIRKPVTLNSVLGIQAEEHEPVSVPQPSVVQPTIPHSAPPATSQPLATAALVDKSQPMTMPPAPLVPPAASRAVPISSTPQTPSAVPTIQMNPNLPPPRPSAVPFVASAKKGSFGEGGRDVKSHPFFQKTQPQPLQPSTEIPATPQTPTPLKTEPSPTMSAYQEPIDTPQEINLREDAREIPELNLPGRPTTPAQQTPPPVSRGPELNSEEPEPVRTPEPLPPVNPQPTSEIPNRPTLGQEIPRPSSSFIRPVAPPRPLPTPQLRPSVAFGGGGPRIPAIDLRDAKKPSADVSTQGGYKERLGSAINLKEFPPIPTPSVTPPADVPIPALAKADAAAAQQAASPTAPTTPLTPDTSPANARRQLEEQQALAKVTAPVTIQTKDGDPYLEAVD